MPRRHATLRWGRHWARRRVDPRPRAAARAGQILPPCRGPIVSTNRRNWRQLRVALSNNKPCTNGIIAVDQPARGADDIGLALHRRAHRRLFAEHGLADQAALEQAGAEEPLAL